MRRFVGIITLLLGLGISFYLIAAAPEGVNTTITQPADFYFLISAGLWVAMSASAKISMITGKRHLFFSVAAVVLFVIGGLIASGTMANSTATAHLLPSWKELLGAIWIFGWLVTDILNVLITKKQ